MALTDTAARTATPAPSTTEPGRGFRPTSRRRARIAVGAAIAAVAVGGNVLVYSSLDDSTEVVQFTDNIDAGQLITSADVRVVEIGGDVETANLVPADQMGTIVGHYARTYLPSGSLASAFVVQPAPLVSGGTAVVSITPTGGGLPSGLIERSRVWVVLADSPELPLVEGRVVSIDRDNDGEGGISVEVAEADAPAVAAAENLRIVLLDPGTDPATAPSGAGGEGTG